MSGAVVLIHLLTIVSVLMGISGGHSYFPLFFYLALNTPVYVLRKTRRFP